MPYRNKTFVSFASEDIHAYRLMCAWRNNQNIAFDFHDAHDLNTARDTSAPQTINRRLRERLNNTKQVVMLIGDETRRKAARNSSFISYEVRAIHDLNLPVVFVNLNSSRASQKNRLPTMLSDQFSVCVSFQPKIIQYALDNFVAEFSSSRSKRTAGPHYYRAEIYRGLGL
ncbi:TIR domain-containing protein [Teredinibacter purpureus]|uniref:TIR domain-containing protein n=1 Tax=Teredinibacter purpureus TaxID=2731756 RepID=UPI0005F7D9E9|nr:TIR domain-containing protein [Teredinibacter purpureus]